MAWPDAGYPIRDILCFSLARREIGGNISFYTRINTYMGSRGTRIAALSFLHRR